MHLLACLVLDLLIPYHHFRYGLLFIFINFFQFLNYILKTRDCVIISLFFFIVFDSQLIKLILEGSITIWINFSNFLNLLLIILIHFIFLFFFTLQHFRVYMHQSFCFFVHIFNNFIVLLSFVIITFWNFF